MLHARLQGDTVVAHADYEPPKCFLAHTSAALTASHCCWTKLCQRSTLAMSLSRHRATGLCSHCGPLSNGSSRRRMQRSRQRHTASSISLHIHCLGLKQSQL